MNRNIITLVGKDHIGIIAKVCTYLAENKINILDITQTTVQEFINMMMIVDTELCTKDFSAMADEIIEIGKAMGCTINVQREDIFNMMHKV
ncbi:MAG: ACT domain-containing protein [Methanomassiliicoccaceae archaeon]|nr:ACT domain-containing protein [Methanomassiliicoccaceae archaeon]